MKKITLFALTPLFAFLSTGLNAQVLLSEDFDGLTIGNVGTDISGVTPGQGDLFTLTSSGANDDFQIVDSESVLGNILGIAGPDTESGSKFVWKDGLSSAWALRTSGNNIIQVEYNFFTGPPTTSKNVEGVELYNSDYSVTIAGFRFIPETKELLGLAYFDNSGDTGLFAFDLGSSPVILLENTWYRVGFAFNVITGEVIWRGTDFYVGVFGAASGIAPFEADFVIFPNTGNAVSWASFYDDFTVRAVEEENLLLGINDNDISLSVNIYPNPVEGTINLSLPSDITATKIEIADMNGRILKSILNKQIKNQIDVSELSTGLYLLNIYSFEGKASKKFMKK